jgi:hypothetical protein
MEAIKWLISTACLGLAACGGGGSQSDQGEGAPSVSPPSVTSQADAALHMDLLRAAGLRGQGIRVGIISTGVVNLASYQAAATLPASVYVSQNTPGKLDEGSWMLELVHQHAPDAILGFCDGLDLDFVGCIQDLVNNFHADIIADDILFSGQFYPDSTAHIVTELEAANGRLVFIHLSGNEQRSGYWQGPFVATQMQLNGAPATVLDFGAASGGGTDTFNTVTVPAGSHLILILNWNDSPHGVSNHALSAHLLDGESRELTQAKGQSDPTLRLDYTNNTAAPVVVRLVVSLDGGGAADGLEVQVTEGAPTCNIECQPLSHAASGLAGGTVGDFADALVVGATSAQSPRTLEPWSNHGPFRIDFQATVDSAAPDGYDYTRLQSPISVPKPDLVAPDCVTVPFSNGATLTNDQFCGTSAAVPAIAGAAALLESAGFDRARVLKSLRTTAVPLSDATWDAGYGFGLADVAAAWHSGGN